MTAAEASRQYQLAVEHARTARTLFSGVISAEDEIVGAIDERLSAYDQLVDALCLREPWNPEVVLA